MSTDPMLDPGGGEPEVWLRPIERADYDPLCRYELSLTLGPRWRHRGTTPSPEALVQSLWSGVLVQYLVQTSLRPEPAGLVTCYGADLQSGTAWLAAARFDDHLHPAAFTAGASQFVDHLFATWPLRKLYAEVLEPNLAPMGRAVTDLFEREGVLRGHAYLDGTYVDQHLLALHRSAWIGRHGRLRAPRPASTDDGAVPSLDVFVLALAAALARTPEEVDLDAPLADQDLDSLDWLCVLEDLERWLPGEVLAALDEAVTPRALHRLVVAAASGAIASRM